MRPILKRAIKFSFMKSFMLSLFLLGFGPIFINAQSITGQALLEKSIQYHDEAANDGEYIPLEGEEIINGIRFPKTRTWFVNKDGRLLGADILEAN